MFFFYFQENFIHSRNDETGTFECKWKSSQVTCLPLIKYCIMLYFLMNEIIVSSVKSDSLNVREAHQLTFPSTARVIE